MSLIFYFLAILIFLIAISLIWRLLSRRQSLPCPSWLGWMVEMENPFTSMSRSGTVIQHADIGPCMSVLDAGCGPGRVTLPAARAVGSEGKVVALDMQAGMLSRVQKKAESENLPQIETLQADLGQGRLTSCSFDRALLVTVLGEIPDQETALKELYDVLKPDGLLIITEIIFDPHFQRRSKVLDLATRVGFEEKQRYGNALTYALVFKKNQ